MSKVFDCTHLWSRPNSHGQRWCRHCDIEANAWMNLVKEECNRISSYEEHRETTISFYRSLGSQETEEQAVKPTITLTIEPMEFEDIDGDRLEVIVTAVQLGLFD